MNATICIGNSDDKLTQLEWARFQRSVQAEMELRYPIRFAGTSLPNVTWQNACWVVEVGDDALHLKAVLAVLARDFKQDSIALMLGEPEFIEPKETL